MLDQTYLVIGLVMLTGALILYLVLKPSATADRGGRVLAFVALFILPSFVLFFSSSEHIERAKTTDFCLSCHVMDDYGKSLFVDDEEYVPAKHFQNNLVPHEKACYTCHTDYTMFGDMAAKLRGLKHIYVQYLGTIPDTLRLYTAYNNRECLHCHEGARSFEESPWHNVEMNELSCMTSGCHDAIHGVHELNNVVYWKEAGQLE